MLNSKFSIVGLLSTSHSASLYFDILFLFITSLKLTSHLKYEKIRYTVCLVSMQFVFTGMKIWS